MGLLIRLVGLALLLLGIYFLGQNIYFSTNSYPYWWRGIAADASIWFLTAGVLMFFVLKKQIFEWYSNMHWNFTNFCQQ
nr:hypothetical protein [Myxosarcina sp. GI1]